MNNLLLQKGITKGRIDEFVYYRDIGGIVNFRSFVKEKLKKVDKLGMKLEKFLVEAFRENPNLSTSELISKIAGNN